MVVLVGLVMAVNTATVNIAVKELESLENGDVAVEFLGVQVAHVFAVGRVVAARPHAVVVFAQEVIALLVQTRLTFGKKESHPG